MIMGKTWTLNPPSRMGTTKELMASEKTRSEPARMPGRERGSATSRKARKGEEEHPAVAANDDAHEERGEHEDEEHRLPAARRAGEVPGERISHEEGGGRGDGAQDQRVPEHAQVEAVGEEARVLQEGGLPRDLAEGLAREADPEHQDEGGAEEDHEKQDERPEEHGRGRHSAQSPHSSATTRATRRLATSTGTPSSRWRVSRVFRLNPMQSMTTSPA